MKIQWSRVIKFNIYTLVFVLVEFCVIFVPSGSTPIHDACKQGMYKVVESLVQQGAYVGVTDVEGHTPLQVELFVMFISYNGVLGTTGMRQKPNNLLKVVI